jgi:ribosomal protein L11 methyltransferase
VTQYFKVEIRNLPEQHQDAVSGIAFMHGASGLAENLRFTQKDLSYDPDIRKSDLIDLDIYFENDPSLEFF